MDYVTTADLGGFFLALDYQLHIFHSLTVLIAGGDNINPGCVNAAVSENVCKLGNVLFNAVKGTGK